MVDFSFSAEQMLKNRYVQLGEEPVDIFKRVANYYSDDKLHAARLQKYMENFWFMPATPILSNGGTNRGLPISCFVNEISDHLESIIDGWAENAWLAAKGGGVGTLWSNIRPLGSEVENRGKSSGVIPFIVVQESIALAISQGSLRRGSSAAYLHVSHPEIEEFLDMRRPTGGDHNRKALELHNAVVVNDAFMEAVEHDKEWNLISPLNKKTVETLKARDLWIKILTTRLETGEPYILFENAANNDSSDVYKQLGLSIKTSNLCSEIMLHTGIDDEEKNRTAVCCLSSLNIDKFDEWSDDEIFIQDVVTFLDNVLSDFILKANESGNKYLANAAYSASQERSIGLGALGFHSYLQKNMIAFESEEAKKLNRYIFGLIHEKAIQASVMLASKKQPAPDSLKANLINRSIQLQRNVNVLAIAPTASIAVICGNVSHGIEPFVSNAFTRKTLDGSFAEKNKYLKELLQEKGKDTLEVWSSITTNEGSVQHLDFLTKEEKDIFKTAFEINQNVIIDLASERQKYICQGQSLNVFLPANVDKKTLNQVHLRAWKKGLKSLYYCRSRSIQRAAKVSQMANENACDIRNKDCESCQ